MPEIMTAGVIGDANDDANDDADDEADDEADDDGVMFVFSGEQNN